MDPELYVFPKINNPFLKAAASTGVFVGVLIIARLLLPLVGARVENAGPWSWVSLATGYVLFIYASMQAWQATREKNTVEDPKHERATCLLDTGAYGRVRHPMYGMFILADAGLGLAAHSYYGLGFTLLTLVMFVANGIFEERAFLLPQFGDAYRDYMRRVPARYFTPAHFALLLIALILTIAALVF